MPEQEAPADEQGQEPTPESGQEPQQEAEETLDVERAKAKIAKANKEAEGLRRRLHEAEQKVSEFEDRDKSELEKLTDQLQAEQKRAQEAQARLLRFEVATEKKVPTEAIDLLSGSTKEELEAQADRILSIAKQESAPAPSFDGGARDPAPEPKTPEQAHNDFLLQLAGKTTQ